MPTVVAAVLLLASTAAMAAGNTTKIATLDVKATGTIDPKRVEGLSSLIASQVSQHPGVEVSSGADLRTLIGFDRERQLLGCSDSSCLAEIGGALGVDYLVSSEVSIVGKTWLVSLALLEVAKARTVNRLTLRIKSEDELIDSVIEGLDKLLLELTGGTGPARAEVEPKRADVSSSSSGTIGDVLLLGGGAVAVVGGGLMIAAARATKSQFDEAQVTDGPSITRADAASARTRTGIGIGLVGVGGALVTWAAVRYFTRDDAVVTAFLNPADRSAAVLVSVPLP